MCLVSQDELFVFLFQLGRKYIVGRQIITIREPAVKMLLLWSTHPYCDRKPIDEKVVQTLLMSSVSAEELELGNIKEPLKIFIEGMVQTLKRLFVFQNRFKIHSFPTLQTSFESVSKSMQLGSPLCNPTLKPG